MKLKLYIRGMFITETEIEPPLRGELDFEEYCKLRESFVRYKTEEFRIQYLRQIIKEQHNYEIILSVGSSMNSYISELKRA
jgi:hypothetical protein